MARKVVSLMQNAIRRIRELEVVRGRPSVLMGIHASKGSNHEWPCRSAKTRMSQTPFVVYIKGKLTEPPETELRDGKEHPLYSGSGTTGASKRWARIIADGKDDYLRWLIANACMPKMSALMSASILCDKRTVAEITADIVAVTGEADSRPYVAYCRALAKLSDWLLTFDADDLPSARKSRGQKASKGLRKGNVDAANAALPSHMRKRKRTTRRKATAAQIAARPALTEAEKRVQAAEKASQ